jgi:hypothetical protein
VETSVAEPGAMWAARGSRLAPMIVAVPTIEVRVWAGGVRI